MTINKRPVSPGASHHKYAQKLVLVALYVIMHIMMELGIFEEYRDEHEKPPESSGNVDRGGSCRDHARDKTNHLSSNRQRSLGDTFQENWKEDLVFARKCGTLFDMTGGETVNEKIVELHPYGYRRIRKRLVPIPQEQSLINEARHYYHDRGWKLAYILDYFNRANGPRPRSGKPWTKGDIEALIK